jgi:hypothetical protein
MADGSYKVIDQLRDTAVNDATGKVERGWRVYYTDKVTGVSGDVFVPDSDYTAKGVDTLIMHVLDRIRAVHALGTPAQ